tara:strand:+ start:838 stop:1260 length:423 start_codon:yes stop_codon:yes gene_type:complete
MEKFIKLFKSGSGQNKGDILIPIKGIMEIKQESDTVVNIFYNSISSAQAGYAIANDGSATVPPGTNVVQSYKITHDAIVANSSSFKDFLNESVEHALQLSWQHPVYSPNGSAYPASAASASVPVTVTAIELGVKAAGVIS